MNLSDGHARQDLTPSQRLIIADMPRIFTLAACESQDEAEIRFVESFAALAGQPALPRDRRMLSYSASSAISLVSLLLKRRSLSAALIEPTFDNIPNILRSYGVPLSALPEEALDAPNVDAVLRDVTDDVLWVVCPNNPTGFEPSSRLLSQIVEWCSREHKVLVLDFCFRFFSSHLTDWDQYDLLERSGISYIAIEDTGKTWPTMDMKTGITVCSADLFEELYEFHDDLLLNVSAFHLSLLRAFIEDTRHHGLEETVRQVAHENRRVLREALAGSSLTPTVNSEATTMEWLRIDANYSGEDLWRELRRLNIHILPGSNFFWQSPELGSQFVRVPLNRPLELIARASPILRRLSDDLAAPDSKRTTSSADPRTVHARRDT